MLPWANKSLLIATPAAGRDDMTVLECMSVVQSDLDLEQTALGWIKKWEVYRHNQTVSTHESPGDPPILVCIWDLHDSIRLEPGIQHLPWQQLQEGGQNTGMAEIYRHLLMKVLPPPDAHTWTFSTHALAPEERASTDSALCTHVKYLVNTATKVSQDMAGHTLVTARTHQPQAVDHSMRQLCDGWKKRGIHIDFLGSHCPTAPSTMDTPESLRDLRAIVMAELCTNKEYNMLAPTQYWSRMELDYFRQHKTPPTPSDGFLKPSDDGWASGHCCTSTKQRQKATL